MAQAWVEKHKSDLSTHRRPGCLHLVSEQSPKQTQYTWNCTWCCMYKRPHPVERRTSLSPAIVPSSAPYTKYKTADFTTSFGSTPRVVSEMNPLAPLLLFQCARQEQRSSSWVVINKKSQCYIRAQRGEQGLCMYTTSCYEGHLHTEVSRTVWHIHEWIGAEKAEITHLPADCNTSSFN